MKTIPQVGDYILIKDSIKFCLGQILYYNDIEPESDWRNYYSYKMTCNYINQYRIQWDVFKLIPMTGINIITDSDIKRSKILSKQEYEDEYHYYLIKQL